MPRGGKTSGSEKLKDSKAHGNRGNRNFTEEERRSMVDVLSMNDWDYHKTQRELAKDGIKIAISSLKSYRKKYEGMIENLPAKHIAMWEEKLDKRQDSLLDKTFKLQEIVIDRLTELIPMEKNVNTLISAMAMLNQVTSGEKKLSGYDKGTSLIAQINQHLTVQSNEQKGKSSGDIQDATVIGES